LKAILVVLLLAGMAQAQDVRTPHKFWSKRTIAIAGALIATSAWDAHQTWLFRSRGYQEGGLNNSLVDNKPAFVAYLGSRTAGELATMYWLHRANHHRMESLFGYTAVGNNVYANVWNQVVPHDNVRK
jgi:hypothetical protein